MKEIQYRKELHLFIKLNMRICLQLLQNYLKQEIPTIIITIDKQKYIFNMPTCFQRFIKDHKQKFPKGSNIFFTKASTDTLAGLSGFMLTIFESKFCLDTKLFVGDEIFNYLEEMRYKMGFKILPYSYSNLFSQETRTGIRQIPTIMELINREDYAEIFMNSEQYIQEHLPKNLRNQSKHLLNEQNHFNDGDLRILPFQISAKGEKIINYICIPNKLQGKVLKDKLKEFKVPNHQISKLLAQGILVVEGLEVRAEQVRQPDSPSPNFLILHYNSLQAVEAIFQHPTLRQYLIDPHQHTNSVVHIVQNNQDSVVESQQFRILLKSFSPDVKHLIYNRHYRNQNDIVGGQTIPKHLELVSLVHEHFPNCMPNILQQHKAFLQKYQAKMKVLEQLFPGLRLLAYKRCHQLVLAPKKSQGYIVMDQNIKEKKEFNLQNLIPPENIMKEEPQYGFENCNPSVVFLGTGSMKPSKYRNVSSIFLQFSAHQSILLDCGEGSYYQLFNHYGEDQIDEILLSLRTIFITHIHSDHNLGILDMIGQRNKLLKQKYKGDEEAIQNNKVFLIIPYNVLPWFQSYVSKIENLLFGCEVLFVQTILNQPLSLSSATISKDERQRPTCFMKDEREEQLQQAEDKTIKLEAYFSPFMKQLYELHGPQQPYIMQRFQNYLTQLGVEEFLPVHVEHCPQSFGVVISHQSKVKISYSGDCRPSEEFAKAAMNSTLLIHEATFGDDLQNNAQDNMHSTVGEAIDIGMKSNSWKCALTHFSQRYVSAKEIVNPSIYKLNKQKHEYASNHTIVCFDHLQMKMSELPLLVYQSKQICEIFPSDSQQ